MSEVKKKRGSDVKVGVVLLLRIILWKTTKSNLCCIPASLKLDRKTTHTKKTKSNSFIIIVSYELHCLPVLFYAGKCTQFKHRFFLEFLTEMKILIYWQF